VLLLVDGFIFLVTLIPPLFNWKNKKVDSRKRIFFAAFACLTFYFWLSVLAIQSLYCFGFWAHEGPCLNATELLEGDIMEEVSTIAMDGSKVVTNDAVNDTNSSFAIAAALVENTVKSEDSIDPVQCVDRNRNSLKNVTLVNFLILIVLIIVIAANINEGKIYISSSTVGCPKNTLC
jgi:hypothetical protein